MENFIFCAVLLVCHSFDFAKFSILDTFYSSIFHVKFLVSIVQKWKLKIILKFRLFFKYDFMHAVS